MKNEFFMYLPPELTQRLSGEYTDGRFIYLDLPFPLIVPISSEQLPHMIAE